MGYGVIEGTARKPVALEYGTFSSPRTALQSTCLLSIKRFLDELIKKWQPDVVAIEGIIFVQSIKTAITMGAAKSAAVLAAAEAGLNIVEYAPKSVKLAVTGSGKAQKDQVAFMMRALMGLTENPAPDAADALAIAYTHMNASDPLKSKAFESKNF